MSVQKPAVRLSTFFEGVSRVNPAVLLTTFNSGTSLTSVKPAVRLGTAYENPGLAKTAPAVKVTEVTYTLVHNPGALTATSTGTWANPANAQGRANGTNSTNANTLTAAASGQLTLVYPAQPNRTALTITSASLVWAGGYAPGGVGPGTFLLEVSYNGGTNYTTLDSGATARTSPTYNLTTAIGNDWTKVAGFRARFTFTAAGSATPSTITVESVVLTVNATHTQTQ